MSKEAMKLALEALESVGSFNPEIWGEVDRAKAALREALAEQPAYRAVKTFHEGKPVYVAEQPAPTFKEYERGFIDGMQEQMRRSVDKAVNAMAQRTWVGLTDEEIEQGCKESWVTEQAWQSAVWWAEAKLKEKNT